MIAAGAAAETFSPCWPEDFWKNGLFQNGIWKFNRDLFWRCFPIFPPRKSQQRPPLFLCSFGECPRKKTPEYQRIRLAFCFIEGLWRDKREGRKFLSENRVSSFSCSPTSVLPANVSTFYNISVKLRVVTFFSLKSLKSANKYWEIW